MVTPGEVVHDAAEPRRHAATDAVAHNPNVDLARAGVPAGGVIVISPGGHIGFRSVQSSGCAHGARPYLILDPAEGPVEEGPRT